MSLSYKTTQTLARFLLLYIRSSTFRMIRRWMTTYVKKKKLSRISLHKRSNRHPLPSMLNSRTSNQNNFPTRVYYQWPIITVLKISWHLNLDSNVNYCHYKNKCECQNGKFLKDDMMKIRVRCPPQIHFQMRRLAVFRTDLSLLKIITLTWRLCQCHNLRDWIYNLVVLCQIVRALDWWLREK